MTKQHLYPYMTPYPIKINGIWRVCRYDGDIVGAFSTKSLAQHAIDTQAWLRHPVSSLADDEPITTPPIIYDAGK